MAGLASGFTSTRRSGLSGRLSRAILWLATAAFCIGFALACTIPAPAEPQTGPPAGASGRPAGAPASPGAAAQAPSPVQTPVSAPAKPQTMPTDAARGLIYVRAACAECHQVEPSGGQPPYSGAPAFHKVAITPGMTSIALMAWLHTSHPSMPNLIVPRDRLDDLLAYFGYLKEAGRTGG